MAGSTNAMQRNVAPLVNGRLPGTDAWKLARPSAHLVLAVDPDKPFTTPEKKERTNLLNEVRDVLKDQGVEHPNPDELDNLVEIRTGIPPATSSPTSRTTTWRTASWRCTTRSTCGAGTNSSRHCAGGATRVRTYRTVSLMVFPAATHWAYQGTARTRPLGDGHAPCVKVLTGTLRGASWVSVASRRSREPIPHRREAGSGADGRERRQ